MGIYSLYTSLCQKGVIVYKCIQNTKLKLNFLFVYVAPQVHLCKCIYMTQRKEGEVDEYAYINMHIYI